MCRRSTRHTEEERSTGRQLQPSPSLIHWDPARDPTMLTAAYLLAHAPYDLKMTEATKYE